MRSRKNASGKFPIYARIVIGHQRVEILMKTTLLPKEWNHGKGEALPLNDDLKDINQLLFETRQRLTDHYIDLSKRLKEITPDLIKHAFLGNHYVAPKERKPYTAKEPEKTLLWLIKEHNTIMLPVLKWGTMKNYYTTEVYIRKFLNTRFSLGDVLLRDLKYSFLTHFENYVRTTPLKKMILVPTMER